jgi:Icc-related predicted phosphoesterase
MKLAFLSDTHMKHEAVVVPPCDVLVHAGDFSDKGTEPETTRFLDWLSSFGARKILIGGNWDRFAEAQPDAMRALCAARQIHWLVDQSAEVLGLRVHGSPWTPRFRNKAWNADPPLLERVWQAIPGGLDLLVTHGPPRGIRDRMVLGAHVGDALLRKHVLRALPRIHAFGHIHEGHGEERLEGVPTRFLNVATCRLLWGTRAPVVVEL